MADSVAMRNFFNRLRRTPRHWRVTRDGEIRCKGDDCPVIAVAFPESSGGIRNGGEVFDIGRDLGLMHGEVMDIVIAADNPSSYIDNSLGTTFLRVLSLRKRLLRACGLSLTGRNR